MKYQTLYIFNHPFSDEGAKNVYGVLYYSTLVLSALGKTTIYILSHHPALMLMSESDRLGFWAEGCHCKKVRHN